MAESGEGDKKKTLSFRMSSELHEQFMLAIKKEQVEGRLELDAERSEVLRRLVRAYLSDPSIIEKGAPDSAFEEDDEN